MALAKDSFVSFGYNGKHRVGYVDSDDGYYLHVTEVGVSHTKKFIWDDMVNFQLISDKLANHVLFDVAGLGVDKVTLVGDYIVLTQDHKDKVVDVAKGLQLVNGNLVVNGVDKGKAPAELVEWASSLKF